jgi:hypothetical protein
MSSAGILSAAGRPMVAFGGANSFKTFFKGDVTISLQWVKVDENDEAQPCMCVYRSHASRLMAASNSGVYVIPQNTAYLYADSKSGAPTPYLVQDTLAIAQHLGFFPDKNTCFRIADAIVDALPDLIRMPDVSAELDKKLFAKGKVGLDLQVKLNGSVVHEAGV